MLLGGFHEGSWLSCRGEDTRWERGGGINITLFNDKNIIIKGSALAYTLPTNIWESQDKISYEWDTGVKSPWFEMKVGEAFNGKTNQHRRRIQGKGGFYAPWGSLEGEGIWVHETLWNRSVKLKGNFAGGKNVKSFIFKTSLELFHNNISLPHDYDLISSCETCLFFFTNWEGRFSLLLPLKKNNPWQEGAEFTGEISFKY